MSTQDYLTGWHSGKWPGGTYGLRFGKLRDSLVEGRPSTLQLALQGGESIEVRVTDGFWEKCPEVRDSSIADWIIGQEIPLPWPAGKPPRFPVARIRRNCFRVSQAGVHSV